MKALSPLTVAAIVLPLVSCGQLEFDGAVDRSEHNLATGSTVIPTTGQTFEIAIDSPEDGVIVPLGPVTVTGNVAIGGVAGTPVNILSMADLSGSTQAPFEMDCNGDGVATTADDLNGDGRAGDVLDCEIGGITALNTSLFGSDNVDVGLIGFGLTAASADMQPATGDQPFTAPPEVNANANLVVDHEEVVRSLRRGRINAFTTRTVGTWTHFDDALAAMNAAFATQPAGERNIAFFLSDGNPVCNASTCSGSSAYTGLVGPLATAVANGTIVNTFTVGESTDGCVAGAPMREIADATGGTCLEVADPSMLSNALPNMVPSGLDRVEVNETAVAVDPLGNFELELVCSTSEALDIEAIGYADDVDATSVQAEITVVCCDDPDADDICADVDNCLATPNTDQADTDVDGSGDACDACPNDAANDADGDGVCGDVDNCPATPNTDQADTDVDGSGDACDVCPNDAVNDADGDGVCGDVDNCPATPNTDQADADVDGSGDACDVCPNDAANDADGDGVCGDVDNCPATPNTDQADTDVDGSGDACDACPNDAANDADGDGVCGDVDNCPATPNTDQADTDVDGSGDACDACPNDAANDADGDGVCGDVDNCPATPNTDQADTDVDGSGDACDVCPNDAANDADADGVCGDVDNCPATPNTDQADTDVDGSGDICDACPNDDANDADADGLCGDVDVCAGTEIPESVPTQRLGVNRFALVDDDGVFDTTSPGGGGPDRGYTIEDTRGCSCEQIIAAQGLGNGHIKFGCSIGAMDNWITELP